MLTMFSVESIVAQNKFISCFAVDDAPSLHGKTLILSVGLSADYEGDTKASFVVSAQNDDKVTLWQSFPLQREFSRQIMLPSDVLDGCRLKAYIYNPELDTIDVDSVAYNVECADIPSFVPKVKHENYPRVVNVFSQLKNTGNIRVLFSKDEKNVILADGGNRIATRPLSMFISGYFDGEYFENQSSKWTAAVKKYGDEMINVRFVNSCEYARTEMTMTFREGESMVKVGMKTKVKKNLQIERIALVVPFRDEGFIVYDSRLHASDVDATSKIQNEYYLDHEGLSLNVEGNQLNVYHPEKISSMQLDAANSLLIMNLDYEKDHPFVHFPLNNDTADYFIDRSMSEMKKGDVVEASFIFSMTQPVDLPRIMPVWDGFESAIIFTEHADWTDIRTHRAVCFGNENVTCADSAVGGFVYYDIPVTKSVFYCNPDSVKNMEKNSYFPDLHSTIKTDPSFLDFLKQLKDKGFDICLHTPEQYTTHGSDLSEALEFMKENFGSPSWIDHGYNNSAVNNRENIVCDGFDISSPYYVCDLWRDNGVKYPWNAAYEELKPFDNWLFDNNIQHPYPFVSNAFPKPRVMRLPSKPEFLMWATEYTIEPGESWNYYFSIERLMKIVESRSVFIAHAYPAWVETFRGFWDMEDGEIVAKPDFNEALQRIANLREKKLMLTTTIDKYMHYQEQLQNIEYQYDNDGNVVLKNNNDEIVKGFSLISKSKMKIENKHFETRISNGEYIIFFDLDPREEIRVER